MNQTRGKPTCRSDDLRGSIDASERVTGFVRLLDFTAKSITAGTALILPAVNYNRIDLKLMLAHVSDGMSSDRLIQGCRELLCVQLNMILSSG